MGKTYIDQPVSRRELENLVEIATDEERACFVRNPHLIDSYRDRLLAIALCQGAALQYLGQGYGVNDFDLHYFYAQNPEKPRLSRAVGRTWTSVGAFQRVPVDFGRTVVPHAEPSRESDTVVRQLRQFVASRRTSNAAHLETKAVVGLWPLPLFGLTIWLSSRPLHPTADGLARGRG
jgi:hypothetical protein